MTHFSILPPNQRRLWPHLASVPTLGFTLYGGTAVALRFGHRQSVDFDFFTDHDLDVSAIVEKLPFLAEADTLQEQNNTWMIMTRNTEVKLSFFGGIHIGRVGDPQCSSDGVLQIASEVDLMATKLKVIPQRAESKDYIDIACMVDNGVSLATGLGAGRAMYGATFQPEESLRALTYFHDGDLEKLADSQRNILINAVRSISEIPVISLRSRVLSVKQETLPIELD